MAAGRQVSSWQAIGLLVVLLGATTSETALVGSRQILLHCRLRPERERERVSILQHNERACVCARLSVNRREKL